MSYKVNDAFKDERAYFRVRAKVVIYKEVVQIPERYILLLSCSK
jgi:hypothetical protein